MASQKVHGITIDLDVNTNGVTQSFSQINKSINSTQRELKAVDKLLKDDAGNTELLAQKQSLLTDAIDKTSAKLKQLYEAKAKADKDSSIDKDSKEYRELTRDIARTESSLNSLRKAEYENNDALDDSQRLIKLFGNGMKEASNEAASFGDILKANVIGDFIVDGIKQLANVVKDFAGDLHEWAEGYRELEVYEKQFESNIKNTADATDEQIASLKQLAKQKERNGVISAKAITSAYQELATYVEEAESIEGLTDALTDMAAQQYGVDATDESVRNLATTLGKALANGDYSGLTRLGYGFTDAQERIMKFGTEAQRVAVINDVISSSIGGMNQALAETDSGKIFQMASYFDDVKEAVGEVVSELEVGFIEQILPELQPFIDDGLKWVIDNKDNLVNMVSEVVKWLTSEDTKQMFKDIGQTVIDVAELIGSLVTLLDDLGLIKGALDLIQLVLEGIRDIFDSIVEDVNKIKNGGLGKWLSGNYNSYSWDSGDYFSMGSGGFMSAGSITLNNTFTINNASAITEQTVRNWANIITDQVNENLGRMV